MSSLGTYVPRFGVKAVYALCIAAVLGGCQREESVAVQGYVEGEFVYMAPPAAGILKTLKVEPGDWVESGTVLFSMDSEKEQASMREAVMRLEEGEEQLRDARLGQRPTEIRALEARLKQAQAALELSLKTLKRQEELFETRVIAQEELDQARAQAERDQATVRELQAELATGHQGQRMHQVAAAEANVAALQAAIVQAKWDLEQTTQSAAIDAQVFDTFFRPGEIVAAGRPVVSLLPPGQVKVRAFLPEAIIGSLTIGSKATVAVDGVTTTAVGTVSFISPKAEFTPPVIYSREMRQKLSFMVEIVFPDNVARGLHPGQPVDVYFEDWPK